MCVNILSNNINTLKWNTFTWEFYLKIDFKFWVILATFSLHLKWFTSFKDASTIASDFETTFVLRVIRARWCLTSELSCSIGNVKSFPVKSWSSGIILWYTSQSSVKKNLPLSPILSISCLQVFSPRSPNTHPRVRRVTPQIALQIHNFWVFFR